MESDNVIEEKSTSRLVAGLELLIAAALVAGANIWDVVPINETPWLIAIGWLALRLRGRLWSSIGLRRPDNWLRTIAMAALAGIALQALSEFVIEPTIQRFTGERPDLSEFQSLADNLPESLVMLGIIWTFAAFGEEMGYRGYILDRAAALGRYSSVAYLAGMIIVSLLFGVGHYYQGTAGMLGSAVSGLFFGALYLASGKNLWLPILAHGISDTIGLAIIYLGLAQNLAGQ